jgi:hypothetical protein
VLVQLNVEMAGTEAIRVAIEQRIAPYQKALDLQTEREEVANQLSKLPSNLQRAKNAVPDIAYKLANLPERMQPVEFEDNTIRIVPVRTGSTTQPVRG